MPTRADDPIKHIVVLMLENQSLDRMLGALRAVYREDFDGVDPSNLRWNVLGDQVFSQAETTTLCVDPDPKHELKNVLRQIEKESEFSEPPIVGFLQWVWKWLKAITGVLFSWIKPGRVEAMRVAEPYRGAFVLDYAKENKPLAPEKYQEIMGYYPLDFLPALHLLGRHFTVCDQWFSSVPGPTWANRFFVHSGTTLGRVTMPDGLESFRRMLPHDQTTLYKRLTEQGISWGIYFGDIPQSFAMTEQVKREAVKRYRPMRCFYDDVKDAQSFPEYCFIEPRYFLSNANDDHPPHNVMHAECLVADVYNALRANESLWTETLFVILFDEHGGFFDHVEPTATVNPGDGDSEYNCRRLGVRVPALLISPWVRPHVLSTPFDHTSLLKYLTEKWDLGPLGERVRQASSIGACFQGMTEPRKDTPALIEDSVEMAAARNEPTLKDAELNGNQRALLALSEWLATKLEPSRQSSVRAQALRIGADPEVEQAKEVVEQFIQQEWEK